jgi:asparagine synthase (glutamine-hydrolysing)
MFAFAWYDARQRRVTLARDRTGIKPLYWTTHNGSLAFASELKALHTLPWLDRSIDVHAAVSHISNLCALNDRTMFTAVRRLQPGHLMTWDQASGIAVRRYADPPYSRPPTIHDRKQAKEKCLDVLRTSVKRQCISDVIIGGFLSGGMDSSIIAAIASGVGASPQGYPSFTMALDGQLSQIADGFAEDYPFAQLVASHLGVPLTSVAVDAHSVVEVDKFVWQLDEPVGDPAALNVSAICAAARAQGVKVLLSGAGADDVFSGYRRHQALMFQGVWTWLPSFARRLLASASSRLQPSRPVTRRLMRVLRDSDLSEDERIVGAFMWLKGAEGISLLSDEAASTLGDWLPEQDFLATLKSLPRNTHRLFRMLALEQRHFLADHNLIYTDKMSMAHGVEVRVPFLDDAVVRLAEDIDPQLHHRTWDGKSVLRDAAQGLVPPAILHRPKTGFGMNLRKIMSGEILGRISDLAHGTNPACGGLFSPVALRKLLTAHSQGRIDASYPLYTVLCIESWIRQFRGRL